MSQDNQSGWEWSQEDERRWKAENMDCDRDIAMYEYFDAQEANERLLADFDSIF